MKKSYFCALLVFLILHLGCQPEEISKEQLQGIWVEVTDRTDTLVFAQEPFHYDKYFTLNRGKEIRNGHVLPKYGSGTYQYQLKDNTISVYNLLSSCYCFHDYHFELKKDQISIGDFYQKNTSGQQRLTFQKVE